MGNAVATLATAKQLWRSSVAQEKVTINISREDLQRLNELRALYPFAKTHALVQLAFRIGLEADPEQLVERHTRERSKLTAT